MAIIYKLVGIPVTSDTKTELKHQDWDNSKKEITFNDIETYFKSLGCSSSGDVLKFITDSETMKPEKSYQIIENRTIFIFTMDQQIKNKLISIFEKHGYVTEKKESQANTQPKKNSVDETLSRPIPLDEIKIDESVIQESNKETVDLFSKENFRNLLKIYSEDPEMYKRFSSYISSGDVILTEDRFNVPEDINVDSQLEEIKKLGINMKDEVIISALRKFKGHLNLTLRFLLYNDTVSK